MCRIWQSKEKEKEEGACSWNYQGKTYVPSCLGQSQGCWGSEPEPVDLVRTSSSHKDDTCCATLLWQWFPVCTWRVTPRPCLLQAPALLKVPCLKPPWRSTSHLHLCMANSNLAASSSRDQDQFLVCPRSR
ncbi:uncharacterized protein LOC142772213 [Rhipicephalus microplus]|uniref:uncharacterized protein LOC142772213 n=1 Tax=Rhipicephalus microplus TaxID=6941 RepID=UPI003F6CD451